MDTEHNLLLQACWSGNASADEQNTLSYAAGMRAAGERNIKSSEVNLAREIIARGAACNTTSAAPEYTIEDCGNSTLRATITSGPNAGRMFSVSIIDGGVMRGDKKYKNIDDALASVEPIYRSKVKK